MARRIKLFAIVVASLLSIVGLAGAQSDGDTLCQYTQDDFAYLSSLNAEAFAASSAVETEQMLAAIAEMKLVLEDIENACVGTVICATSVS